MRFLLVFAILLLFSLPASSQPVAFHWAKSHIVGSGSTLSRPTVSTDLAGNVYVSGNFAGTADLDPGPAVQNATAMGQSDFYIIKFDAAGNMLWLKVITGFQTEDVTSSGLDPEGNLLLGGFFSGTVDFDPDAGVQTLSAVGIQDGYVMKLSPDGDLIWARSIGGNFSDEVREIAVDPWGNVYCTGSHFGGDFDPGPNVYNLPIPATSAVDAYILKLSPDGHFIWAGSIASPGYDFTYGLAAAEDGQVALGGIYGFGPIDLDPSANTQLAGTAASGVFFVRLDSSGQFQNGAQVTCSDGGLESIVLDRAGNAYCTGYFSGSADFDPGPGSYPLVCQNGYRSAYIWKLTPAGTLGYAHRIGAGPNEFVGIFGNRLQLDGHDNLYLTGYFVGSTPMDFDPGPGSFTMFSLGNQDVYLMKLDSAGLFQWALRYGGGSTEWPYDLAVQGGLLHTVGHFDFVCDFDPGPGTFNMSTGAQEHTYTQKLGACIPASAPMIRSDSPTLCPGESTTLRASIHALNNNATWEWFADSCTGTPLDTGLSIVVSPMATTTYFARGIGGCADTTGPCASITLRVGPPDPPSPISGPASPCEGSPATFSVPALPGLSYTWTLPAGWTGSSTGPSIATVPGSSGTLTVQAHSACGSSAPFSLPITVAPPYTAAFSFSTSGNSITCTDLSPGATAWSWDFGDGNTSPLQNPTHTYASPGTYTVCLSARTPACSDSTCQAVVVLATADALPPGCRVYPSPTEGLLWIEQEGHGSYRVIDAQGRTLLSGPLEDGRSRLDLSGLPEGLYMICLGEGGPCVRVMRSEK